MGEGSLRPDGYFFLGGSTFTEGYITGIENRTRCVTVDLESSPLAMLAERIFISMPVDAFPSDDFSAVRHTSNSISLRSDLIYPVVTVSSVWIDILEGEI